MEVLGFVGNLSPTKKITVAELADALAADAGSVAALQAALGGGGGGLPTLEITLTDAQIKASPSAPLELFAPLGADQAYIVLGGYAVSNIVAAYTNQDNLIEIVIGWDDDNADAMSPLHIDPNGSAAVILSESRLASLLPLASTTGLFVDVAQVTGLLSSPATAIGFVFNKNLALYVDNGADGNFTGGNAANTLKIVIVYMVATP